MPAENAVTTLATALSADAWVPEADLSRYAVHGIAPLAGIRPATETEALTAMKLVVADAWCVVPWGAGTAQGRGTRPEQYDLCFSTERLTGVVSHYPEDMVVTVRAGTPLAELQHVLGQQGQWWPIDPPDAHATVGGILATNRSGPHRTLYGTARDHVLGMRVLHADGVVTKHGGHVVKNVAGFDLNKLHVGALGTLGIILEVSLKVQPVPMHETVLAAPFPSYRAAAQVLESLAASELAPSAIELLNEAAARAIVPAAAGPAVALVAVQGTPGAVERQATQVSQALADGGGGAVTTIDRADVGHVWSACRDLHAALWCTAAVRPTAVGEVAQAAAAAAREFGQQFMLDARAGNGVLRFGLAGQPQPLLAQRTVTAWRDAVEAQGGTLVVDSAPDTVHGDLDVWGPVREDFPLMRRIKHALDPKRLLNRGRYVGGL